MSAGDGNKPAFPIPENCQWTGMSKLEYFAAKAMRGLLAKGGAPDDPDALATESYGIAAAMVEEGKQWR